jgi:hypothetical protein
VVPRFPQPPSLVADHAKGLPDGQLFHIISRGQGLMPSHAAQVLPADRWKVIQYLRSLQAQASASTSTAPGASPSTAPGAAPSTATATASSTPALPAPTPPTPAAATSTPAHGGAQ